MSNEAKQPPANLAVAEEHHPITPPKVAEPCPICADPEWSKVPHYVPGTREHPPATGGDMEHTEAVRFASVGMPHTAPAPEAAPELPSLALTEEDGNAEWDGIYSLKSYAMFKACRERQLRTALSSLSAKDQEIEWLKAQLDTWEVNEPCPACGEDHKCGVQSELAALKAEREQGFEEFPKLSHERLTILSRIFRQHHNVNADINEWTAINDWLKFWIARGAGGQK